MVTPINIDQKNTFLENSEVGTATPKAVDSIANSGLKSQEAQDSNPYADTIAKLKKDQADLQQYFDELIDERDQLKEEYANATWYNQIGIGIKIGAKLAQILITGARLERLTGRIKEYERGGPIF